VITTARQPNLSAEQLGCKGMTFARAGEANGVVNTTSSCGCSPDPRLDTGLIEQIKHIFYGNHGK
jgi:hypothetical protein